VKATLLPPSLSRLRAGELLVNEFFHSVQGESTHAGRPCFFIRLAACHLRCAWCDTEYAFFEGRVLTVDECIGRAKEAACPLVEITGGEPLLQDSVYALMTGLCNQGHEVLLETSGAVGIERVDPRVRRIVDWKCPGSGMVSRNEPSVIENLRPGDELKLVLADRRDYEWARRWLENNRSRIPQVVPVHFSPVFGALPPRDLSSWIVADRLPVRLSLQLHKSIWNPDARGV